jgi:hypothetical protein
MRQDYRVMTWKSYDTAWAQGDGKWSDAARQRYTDGGYDGVFYQFRLPVRHADLAFLHELPGLRFVEIDGRVADDTAVFGLGGLEEAILIHQCSLPIPEIAAVGMKRLCVFGNRRGLERVSELRKLHDLTVFGWKGEDLGFLAGCKSLKRLKIEAMRQLVSLAGLEGCRKLEAIELWDARAVSLTPLAELRGLKRLALIGDYRMERNCLLDLSDIETLGELEALTITFAGSDALTSLEPLTRMPRLREVRLRGTYVLDGDLSPLSGLRPGTIVVGPNE